MKENEIKVQLNKSQREALRTLLFSRHLPGEEREPDDISPHTTNQKIGMLWISYFQLLRNQASPDFPDKIGTFRERCLVVKDLETLLKYFPNEKDVRGLIPKGEKFDETIMPKIIKDLEQIEDILNRYPPFFSTTGKLFD